MGEWLCKVSWENRVQDGVAVPGVLGEQSCMWGIGY